MKRFLFIAVAVLACVAAKAQELQLSEQGMKHWIAAGALMEAVQTDDGYINVAKEYKKVLVYDPGTPEVLYNIGLVYAHHARKTSNFYSYWDATEYLNKYLETNPEDADEVKTEIVKLDAVFAPLKGPMWRRVVREDGVYEGYVKKNGKGRHGAGVMTSHDGLRKEGDWTGNVLLSGRWVYPDGVITDFTPTGGGIFFPDGRWFYGKWNNNPLEGTMYWLDGSTFDGKFDKLKEHDSAFFLNREGTFTCGEGVIIPNCPGAVKFKGTWKNGLKEGPGTCWDATGKVIYKGNFSNDKPTGTYPAN